MNKPKIDGFVWLVAFLIVLTIGCLSMCSCKTPKTITEYVTVHDTLVSYRTDTIKDVKVVTKIDTVRQVESHTFTINNVGDTVKEIHHYHDTERTIVVDSTERYKATVDSLRKALVILANKEVVKQKPVIRWWEYGIAGLIVCAIAVFVFKSKIF